MIRKTFLFAPAVFLEAFSERVLGRDNETYHDQNLKKGYPLQILNPEHITGHSKSTPSVETATISRLSSVRGWQISIHAVSTNGDLDKL